MVQYNATFMIRSYHISNFFWGGWGVWKGKTRLWQIILR